MCYQEVLLKIQMCAGICIIHVYCPMQRHIQMILLLRRFQSFLRSKHVRISLEIKLFQKFKIILGIVMCQIIACKLESGR